MCVCGLRIVYVPQDDVAPGWCVWPQDGVCVCVASRLCMCPRMVWPQGGVCGHRMVCVCGLRIVYVCVPQDGGCGPRVVGVAPGWWVWPQGSVAPGCCLWLRLTPATCMDWQTLHLFVEKTVLCTCQTSQLQRYFFYVQTKMIIVSYRMVLKIEEEYSGDVL